MVSDCLTRAMADMDPDALWAALGESAASDEDSIPALIELLSQSWHQCHEDIAQSLQRAKDPRAADVLAEAALTRFDYLDDRGDSHPFARKCIWALADIGNSVAREHLERLSQVEDTEIASYAQRRLDRWAREQDRKGAI